MGDESAVDPAVESAEVFEEHRRLLFAVAYRMVGSVAEADDIVQEAWLRWDRADHAEVADPKAYLVRIVSRAALDHLRKASSRLETYVGPWLPEPLLTGPDVADDAATADSVSMAMLVVLETLSPLERAVFVLREAFGFSYAEIGQALGRSEQAARQLSHRAREHVHSRRPRFQAGRGERREVTERFMKAAVGGDLGALLEVLSPDVTLVADGGRRAKAPRRPIHGADKVARWLVGIHPDIPAGTVLHLVDVNGEPAAVATVEGDPIAVFMLEVSPETRLVEVIRLIANPDKLAGVRLPP